MSEAKAIYAEATVTLQGMPRGTIRKVNPESEWVRDKLAAGFLVEVPAPPKRDRRRT